MYGDVRGCKGMSAAYPGSFAIGLGTRICDWIETSTCGGTRKDGDARGLKGM